MSDVTPPDGERTQHEHVEGERAAGERAQPERAAGEQTAGRRRGPRRVVRQGTERESVVGVSADERADGWGETTAGDRPTEDFGSNDDRLRRDVPPHW